MDQAELKSVTLRKAFLNRRGQCLETVGFSLLSS